MKSFLISYLLVTGIGALVALGAPSLVVLGFFLLVIPGLILSLMPTAFLYGLVFAAFWWPLHKLVGEWPAAGIALIGAFGVLWAIPAVANKVTDARIAADRAGDKEASGPIPISGVVRIENSEWKGVPNDSAEGKAHLEAAMAAREAGWRNHPIACDAVCAAALFTPGVEAVILAPVRFEPDDGIKRTPLRAPVQFRIDRSGACRNSVDVGEPGKAGLGAWSEGPALQAEWRTRISAGECIVRETPTLEVDFTIHLMHEFHPGRKKRQEWALVHRPRRVTRLAISDRSGLLVQQTMVDATRLAQPLTIGGNGGVESFRFEWSKQRLGDGRLTGSFKPLELLARLTPLNLKPRPGAAATGARKQLLALLDSDRSTGDPGFALPEIIFGDIRENGLRPGDAELVERIVGDPRTRDLNGVWNVIVKLGADAARLRKPIVDRLLHTQSIRTDANQTLGRSLKSLPSGIFAEPTDDELALLATPVRRSYAAGLIERQADRGAEAVPLLLTMLEDIIRRRNEAGKQSGPALESDASDAIKQALAILGPQAAFARARLEAALEAQQQREDRVKTWHWELTLVRMGRAPESFEKPSWRGGSEADYHQSLRRDVERFERDLAKKVEAR